MVPQIASMAFMRLRECKRQHGTTAFAFEKTTMKNKRDKPNLEPIRLHTRLDR